MSKPNDDRHIFIGQPGYGEVSAGAARGFWRATRLPDRQVTYQYREGSLLAANFNALWASALNAARIDRVDYFAMLHADVEPPDYWLDTLIDELESNNLDVLGVAVPIKDPNGLTSLALDRPDGDPWRPLCRLTTAEVHALPETFTSDDCGHPLLINTGMWVCRFDPAWAKKIHFTVNDRIVTGPDGGYFVQVEPEDWFFSRLCHELGLRIGATRKIRVDHRGPARFGNDRVWGEPHDSAYVNASQLPPETDRWPEFPSDVDGWLTVEEGRALAELAKNKRVLEIGSYCGKSTICMARTAKWVMAVDPFDGSATPKPQGTLEKFKKNIKDRCLENRVDWYAGTLESIKFHRMSRFLEGRPFDLAFIDGDHGHDAVSSDIANVLPLLADDGLIAFHDYRTHPGEHDGRWDPGVTRAVDELLSRGGELVSRSGTVAVIRPPAESLTPLEV
jgi:predicted O-methyltransferase YrrM